MSDPGHEMILASAGSGKTYTLVNRFLKLLVLGEKPGRIIALTFTRKAAGEFLQKIFIRLTEAAGSEAAAKELSKQLDHPGGTTDFYRNLLAELVKDIGELQLGTIDSFFTRIVGAFPYELGLTRAHRMMDAFEENMARQLAMERLMAFGDKDRERLILQLYKELTWGAEEKSVYRLFEENLKDYHGLFLETLDPDLWGPGNIIFKNSPWWFAKDTDRPALLREIRKELENQSWTPSVLGKFDTLLAIFDTWQPGQPINGGVLFDRLLAAHEALAAGRAEFKVGNSKVEITDPLSGYLLTLIQTFVRQEIGRRLLTTRSLGLLLSEFDQHYESFVRETGSLVFADLPMLLIKGLYGSGAAFSADDIVYRLDGQTDHWLVDEFQDTSRIQWKVLSSFIEEVLQDPEGRRTFFYVGDVKQSIYGWRGGDSRLFGEIFQKYNEGDNGIQQSVLNVSWRSAPPVLDCVNQLFGKPVDEPLISSDVAKRWQSSWNPHKPSPLTQSLKGHAAWGLVKEESKLAEACIDLIRTADPIQKGLSCAILVRRNSEVIALTQALREAKIPASMEGVVSISLDNVVGSWIRAWFYALARPDEAFPRGYLRMVEPDLDPPAQRRFAGLIRHALLEQGHAEAVRLIIERFGKNEQLTPFLRRRAEQLLEAATRFESVGSPSLEGFLNYLELATVEESTLSSQVQVMTVHKAKGLDFDMVIVAGFGGDTLTKANRGGVHVERSEGGNIEWILDMPNKQVLEQDAVLSAAREDENSRETFEALCLLYVAMTRARQGLYCLAERPSRNSKSTTWQMFFESAFGSDTCSETPTIDWIVEFGAPDWHEEEPGVPHSADQRLKLEPLQGDQPFVRPAVRRAPSPSTESHQTHTYPLILRSVEGKRFGTLMHDFLATIEWIDFDDKPSLEAILERAPAPIRERLAIFLKEKPARDVFARPDGDCVAWREKPYILRKGEFAANGIIDRATVVLDGAGKPAQVRIYDFKTDTLDPERPVDEQLLERYSIQLERYMEAVGILTGLPETAISARLIPV